MQGSLESMAEVGARQARRLVYLIYIQAAFLAVTYVEGMWAALTVHNFSITLPDVIEHGMASSGFALMTGVVGFVAALRGQRRVAILNLTLFAVAVLAGSTGFAFLANPADPTEVAVTNLSMITTIALGMPISGFSLAKASRASRSNPGDLSPTMVMIYLALGALSTTTIAGAAMLSTTPSWYAFAVSAHVGLAALTVALVLGVLMTSVIGASEGRASTWEPQIVAYSLVALAAAAVAGADGVVYMTTGDLSYVVVMAEVGVLVYAFLLIATGAPYHRSAGGVGRGKGARTPPRAVVGK
ncbi:MAG: hypothetical protein LYZ69_07770 [Nitrososphaerales archaeon]|nr:hypothetical protein [Nitrososphaerales archaeon]